MVRYIKFACLADVALKLRRLLFLVLYVQCICYASLSGRWKTAVQCGIFCRGRFHVVCASEWCDCGGNQTRAEFGCRDLSVNAARGYARTPWFALESENRWRTGRKILDGSSIVRARSNRQCPQIGFVCQFDAPAFQTWKYLRAGFRAFCGCVRCSHTETPGCQTRTRGERETRIQTGEKMTGRVTLRTILERVERDYGTDNALDALRIASTDRAYIVYRRRKRRMIH